MLIFFFFLVPKSPSQMGSLSAKNVSKKFSRLGTFKQSFLSLITASVIYTDSKFINGVVDNSVNLQLASLTLVANLLLVTQ